MSVALHWKNPNSIFEKIVIFRHTEPFENHIEATLIAEMINGESYVDPIEAGDYYYRVGSYVAGTIMLSNMVFKSASETWSPKDLFTNGRNGYFFDFRDKSKMFKNYYGQFSDDGKVRLAQDSSGNNNHMRVPNISFENKKLEGVYNLIDGKSLKMSSSIGGLVTNENPIFGDGRGLYVSAAIKTPSQTGKIDKGYNMSHQVFTSWVSGTIADFVFGYGDGRFSIYLEPGIVNTPYLRASTATPVNTNVVISAETNTSGTKLYINGALEGESAAYTISPRLDGLGAYNNTSSFDGNIYAAVAVFDELNQQEKINLENWMASLIQ